jgi:asparagine synthase (glutamine-hydrolysing)
MCGIAGIIGNYERFDFDKMLQSQQHRGPDYTGIYKDGDKAIFGHNRLAIIDLSAEANQPFFDNSNRYCIVFNGEIYNYLELKKELLPFYDFRTNSDTEVLLAAFIVFGKDFLHKLNGMFAFAIWDFQTQKLFVARDRFGVKPFFYTISNGCFLFSSEIKALHVAGVPISKNEKVWADYFAYDYYGNPDETFFENINQLAGGHFLTYENGKLDIKKWYFLENEITKYKKDLSFDEAKLQYLLLLKDSISLRFRADVSIGVNVSGGLDSSLLLYLINQHKENSRINAYTFYTDSPNYDEIEWVNSIVEQTKNPLSKVLFTAQEVADFLQKISTHQAEPFGGIPTLAYAKIFEKARQDNVVVLLDGQGLDEQFAGYDYYQQDNNNLIQGTKSGHKFKLLSKKMQELSSQPDFPKPFDDAIKNKQYRDLFYTKIPRALRFNDRISMAFSTELREPFLDYRLVEFAFSLPTSFKINDSVDKFLIRSLAADFLPPTLVFMPKRTLQTPQREWLFNDLKEIVEQSVQKILNSDYSKWFNILEFEKALKRFYDGEIENSFFIWQCVSLANQLK